MIFSPICLFFVRNQSRLLLFVTTYSNVQSLLSLYEIWLWNSLLWIFQWNVFQWPRLWSSESKSEKKCSHQSVCFLWEIKAVTCSLSLLTQTYKAGWLFGVPKWQAPCSLHIFVILFFVKTTKISKMGCKIFISMFFFNMFVFCEKSKTSHALCHYLLKRTKLVGCLVCQSDKKTKRAVRTIVSSIPR